MATETLTQTGVCVLDAEGAIGVAEVPVGAPGDDEVAVEVGHVGLNPVDLMVAAGRFPGERSFPFVLGSEGTGRLADGRAVALTGGGLGSQRPGLLARRAVVPAASVLPLPEGCDPVLAAAAFVAGVTALRCVRDRARVGGDDHVLVLGAGGGVGAMALQLARRAGARRVTGLVSSPAKADLATSLGVDEVVVGGPEALAPALAADPPQVVVEGLGGAFTAAAVEVAALEGRVVSFGVSAGARVDLDVLALYRKRLDLLGYSGGGAGPEQDRADRVEVLDAVARGELRPPVTEVVAVGEAADAYRRLGARGVTGKVVVDLAAG